MTRTPILAALLAGIALLSCGASAQQSPAPQWGGAWGYATSPATKAVRGTLAAGTYRMRVRLSQSGDGLGLVFTNPAGAVPLQIGRATVARPADGKGFGIAPASEAALRFADGESITIAAGQAITSLPVDLSVHAGDDVIVTVTTSASSTTVAGNAGFPIAFGEATVGADGAGLQAMKLRPFLTQIAVRNPPTTCTIVAFGDSITEGARGTRPDWRGWPGALAEHLVSAEKKRHCGVVNMGISGNRLLRDGRGTAGIDRFDRDVASVPGVQYLILLEGINDIWHSSQPGEQPLTADDLIAGYRKLIDAGHARGIRVLGATLTPGFGSKYLTPELEQLRQQVNRWIRTGGAFDGVIDFEAVTRDTATPPAMRAMYDSGDHLHPGDSGYIAMGRSVPLALVRPLR